MLIDHVNLNTFFKNKELNRKEARWWEKLSDLDLHIEYKSNKQNSADDSSRRLDYESNESIIVNAIANDINTLIISRVHVHVYNVESDSQTNRNDELSSILFSMKKNCQFSSNLKTANTMNIENDFIRDKNFENIASHAYVNLIVRTRILSTEELVFAIQTKAFHAWFDSRSFEIKKQHEKFKKTFCFVVEETKNIVSREAIKKIALKDINFTKSSIELRIVLKILQKSDQLAQKRMTQAAQTIIVNAWFDDDSKINKWKLKNDILYFEKKYYIFSNLLRRELLKQNHDDSHANHFEYEKILELFRRKYWWFNMSKNVKKYVISCTKCFLTKSIKHKFYELLQSLSISRKLRKNWTMNFIIDLSFSKRREQIYDVILIIIDRYTKYFKYISARKDWTAKQLTNELFDEIFFKQRMLKFIIFDRESLFTFNFWSNFCYHLRIKIRLSIVFHSQTNEQTERQNQTLKQYLRIYINYQQDNWVRLLFVIEYAYNNNWHNVIKMSSFTILYRDDDISRWKDQIQDDSEKNVSTTRTRIEEVTQLRNQLYKRLNETRNNQAKYYDEKHTSRIFNVKDKILLNFRNIHISKSSKKLDHKYYESFEIEEFIEKQAYKLRLSHTFRIHNVFYVSLLKSYKERFDDVIASFSIIINEEKHDEIKLILNSKLYQKRLKYLVKWLNWSDIENQWIYAENVQADDLIKNFYQQYSNKLSTDASNAKRKRIEKNWFNQKRKEFHFQRHEVESQLNYLITFLFFNSVSDQTFSRHLDWWDDEENSQCFWEKTDSFHEFLRIFCQHHRHSFNRIAFVFTS
jgi:hypothetical protein